MQRSGCVAGARGRGRGRGGGGGGEQQRQRGGREQAGQWLYVVGRPCAECKPCFQARFLDVSACLRPHLPSALPNCAIHSDLSSPYTLNTTGPRAHNGSHLSTDQSGGKDGEVTTLCLRPLPPPPPPLPSRTRPAGLCYAAPANPRLVLSGMEDLAALPS